MNMNLSFERGRCSLWCDLVDYRVICVRRHMVGIGECWQATKDSKVIR